MRTCWPLTLAVGCLLATAPSAHAVGGFTLSECSGSLAPGQGSTLQNSPFTGFRGVYALACGDDAASAVTWLGAGSGPGRSTLGERSFSNLTGARDPRFRWA